MDTKSRIKVIKRSEREAKPAVATKKVTEKVKTAQAARDMVATVSSWVTEFQQKRREETKEALNKLFPKTPTPTGCANC